MSEDPWKHRSAGMLCQTCAWYVPKMVATPDPDRPEIGRCRRHAPTLGGFPVMFPTDWCGDHKLDENKVQPMLTVPSTPVKFVGISPLFGDED